MPLDSITDLPGALQDHNISLPVSQEHAMLEPGTLFLLSRLHFPVEYK